LKLDGFDLSNVHFVWSPYNKPKLYIKPGDEVEVLIPDSSTNQIKYDFKTEDMHKIDESKFDGAVGPIYVEGAEEGDTLVVTLKEIEVGNWGWSAILSNFGILKGLFKEKLVIWDIKNGYATAKDFLKGIKIPINPFLGVIGTAPKFGDLPMIPPHSSGGNMDNRLLTQGSVIYFPVNVKGALLSLADPHASQGDGEVSGTAIETSARVLIKVDLRKGEKIDTPKAVVNINDAGKQIVTMGIDKDPIAAARKAVLNMVEELKSKGLSGEEAYILCSVVGNLKMSEVVDEPNYVVSFSIPEKIININA